MTLTHEQKLHAARLMMTRKEISEGVGPFQSAAWMHRRDAAMKRAYPAIMANRRMHYERVMSAAAAQWHKMPWYEKIYRRARVFIRTRFGV